MTHLNRKTSITKKYGFGALGLLFSILSCQDLAKQTQNNASSQNNQLDVVNANAVNAGSLSTGNFVNTGGVSASGVTTSGGITSGGNISTAGNLQVNGTMMVGGAQLVLGSGDTSGGSTGNSRVLAKTSSNNHSGVLAINFGGDFSGGTVFQGGSGGNPNLYVSALANGNVGINTDLPTAQLHVFGGNQLIQRTDGINPRLALFQEANIQGGAGILSFQRDRGASGNVVSPVLHGDELGFVEFKGSDGSAQRRGAYFISRADTSVGVPIGSTLPANLVFYTSGKPLGGGPPTPDQERMRINPDGNVMIGTTTPTPIGTPPSNPLLTVNGGMSAAIISANTISAVNGVSTSGSITAIASPGNNYFGSYVVNSNTVNGAGAGLSLQVSAIPDAPAGGGGGGSYIWDYHNNSSLETLNFYVKKFNTAPNLASLSPLMTLDSNGNLGIGTATPKYPLDVEISASSSLPSSNPSGSTYGYCNNTECGAQNRDGFGSSASVSIYAIQRILASEFDAFSDRRLKEKIEDIQTDQALKFLENSRPVHFRWKSDRSYSYGFIAQDILKLGFKELVNQRADPQAEELIEEDGFFSPAGSSLLLNYDQIAPILTKAMQHIWDKMKKARSQNAQDEEEIRTQLKNLEKRYQDLEETLKALEKSAQQCQSNPRN